MGWRKVFTKQGAPLYLLKVPREEYVALGILVKVGTRDEIWPQEAGMAHAIEHMVFRGTENFPNQKKIFSYVDKLGGFISACTDKEHTLFYLCLPKEKIKRGIKILAQLIRRPLLKNDIEQVKKIIIREMAKRNDNLREYPIDHFVEIASGNHPLGKDILGTEGVVKSFKSKDLRSFWKKWYQPGNFIFIVAGDMDKNAIKKLFEKYFPEKTAKKTVKKECFVLPKISKKKFIIAKDVSQTYLVLGATTCGHDNLSEKYALKLFAFMLDSDKSSPLNQELREKRGLTYEIWANYYCYGDLGYFLIYAGIDTKDIGTTIDIILKTIDKTKRSKDFFELAKKILMVEASLEEPALENVLKNIAFEISLSEKILAPVEKEKIIRRIALRQVKEVAEKYLNPEHMIRLILKPK